MIVKPASAELDYPIRYTLGAGEAITQSDWSVWPVETNGITVKIGSPSTAGSIASCIITGGISGHLYELTNTIVTGNGRTDVRTVTIRVGTMEAVQ